MDCNRCHEKHQVSKMDTNEVSMCVYVGGGESLPREVICNLRGTE